jgi:roadblock/LC7 domain-containing protein
VLFDAPAYDQGLTKWTFLDLAPNRRRALMVRFVQTSLDDGHSSVHITDIRGRPAKRLMTTSSFTPQGGWAPDGRRFFYMTRREDPPEDPCHGFTFWSAIPDGRRIRRLGDGQLFAWGPTHRSFAIQQGCTNPSHPQYLARQRLVFTNPFGRRRLIKRGWTATISVAPRGGHIAFGTFEHEVQTLHISRLDGRRVATIRGATEPAWSPDGRRIAYLGPWRRSTLRGALIVATATGTGRRVVARIHGASYGELQDPSWSPDGKYIAFGRRYRTVEVVRPDGTGARVVATGAGGFSRWWWSPNSRQLYVSGLVDQ